MPKSTILNYIEDKTGTVVAVTLPRDDVKTIVKYDYDNDQTDLKRFIQETASRTISWMRRLLKGGSQYELSTLEHWYYNRKQNTLELVDHNREGKLCVDMRYTAGSLAEYNQGLASVLNVFWYHSYALPTAVVELIAASDLLYREHRGLSPAASGSKSEPFVFRV